MDRRDVESRARLHEDQSRLRPLFAPKPSPSGFVVYPAIHLNMALTPPCAGEVGRSDSLVEAEENLRQFYERPLHRTYLDEYIEKVCRVMLAANWHTYQILSQTRGPHGVLLRANSAILLPHRTSGGVSAWKIRNMVCRELKNCAARNRRLRSLSIEPLLEDLEKIDLRDIHWVIVGGESGPGARPMLPEWARNVRNNAKCKESAFSSSNGVVCAKPETART
jgi:hypothetical protein